MGAELTPDELKQRTLQFGLRTIRLVESLPKTATAGVIGRQMLRSGTSVGANYRAACRARSSAEFVSRMSVVEEEIDETAYWLELAAKAGVVKAELLAPLAQEAKELLAITVASINTARGKTRDRRRR
jgi:four helix bundle protein